MIAKSLFTNKAKVQELFKKTPEEILALEDPFVQYYARFYDKMEPLRKQQKEIMDTENVAFGLLVTNSLQNVRNGCNTRCKQNIAN